MNRFSDEIETINLKQSISKNRTNQHASRLAVIKMSMEREKGEFEGAGIGMEMKKNISILFPNCLRLSLTNHSFISFTELMDLCDPEKFKQFISWDGDSINIQHLKIERIGRKYLQNLDESTKME